MYIYTERSLFTYVFVCVCECVLALPVRGPLSNDTHVTTSTSQILVSKYPSLLKSQGFLEKRLTPGLDQ